jgi:CBS domain-containing protein
MLENGVSHVIVTDPETGRRTGVLSTPDIICVLGSDDA